MKVAGRRWRGWIAGVLGVVVLGGACAAVLRRTAVAAPVGGPAPAFSLPDLQGRVRSLASLGGGDVVLRFGTLACTICDPDWAVLRRWQAAAGPGLHIAAVQERQPRAWVRQQLQGVRTGVPVLVDATGAVAARYGVQTLPSIAFIDRYGALVAVEPVITRTGIWSTATWQYYLGRLRRADAAPAPRWFHSG